MNKLLTLGVCAATLLLAQGAMAEEQWCQPGTQVSADQAKAMLEKEGYQIKHMGHEHGCLEAKGMDPKGKRVEVYVDPTTGKIVRIKD